MITIQGLHLSLDDTEILSDINIELDERAYLTIVGPNGAGKSSLLKAIMRIYDTYQGEIYYQGQSIRQLSQRAWARIVSYVPQSTGRHMPFTVDEFVKMARYAHSKQDWQPKDQKQVSEALVVTDTQAYKDRQMATLSGGEAQRVMIAAALAQDTRVMLLDEPTSYLDPHHQTEVHALIHRLNQDLGLTVIEVTHDINHAAHANKQVLALQKGHSFWQGSGDDWLDADRLSQLYQQDFVFVEHPNSGRKLAIAEPA
jgi:iron complex transport system ATP-binding protein